MVTSLVLTGVGVYVAFSHYEQAKMANEQAFKNSDTYKIQEAVKKFMEKQPFVTPEDANNEVTTAFTSRLRDRLTGWGTNTAPPPQMRHLRVHATVLTGLFEAGKSTALKQTMAGMQGVYTVQLNSQEKCKDAVFDALGVTEAMFTEVARQVTNALRSVSPGESGVATSVPVLVLDIPRDSPVNIGTVSTFAKAYATDAHPGERIHVLAVMSSATSAIGFDAGGPNRRFDLFMEFSKEEAIELLKIRGITNPETAAKIVEVVGTNPGRLECAEPRPVAKAIESNKNDDEVMAAIDMKYRKRVESEVRALLAIQMRNNEKNFLVGREMVAALMKEASVSHARWQKKELTLSSVATMIKKEGGHAVYYHTEREEWFWVSKLHRKEAEKQQMEIEDVIGTI